MFQPMLSPTTAVVRSVRSLICAVWVCVLLSSCGQRSFHDKFDWKAQDFFTDPQTIALCQAIEADDLPEIDRLVAAGANVNDRGSGNMTPLMWAYPDNKLQRFQRLLKHGADPNVVITTHLKVPSGFQPGDSVTILSAGTWFPGYFQQVLEHGGDPNIKGEFGYTPLHVIVMAPIADKLQRIQLALKHGANINAQSSSMKTPTMKAVTWGGQYDLALSMLELGADPTIHSRDGRKSLIDYVVVEEALPRSASGQQAEDFQRLLSWLIEHGQDADKARQEYQERMKNKPPPWFKEN